jgi:hypothetical protein
LEESQTGLHYKGKKRLDHKGKIRVEVANNEKAEYTDKQAY